MSTYLFPMDDGTTSIVCINKLSRPSADASEASSRGDSSAAHAALAFSMAEEQSRSGAPFSGAGRPVWYATLLGLKYRKHSDTWLAWAQQGDKARVVGILITQSGAQYGTQSDELMAEESDALVQQFANDEAILRMEAIEAEMAISELRDWPEEVNKRVQTATAVVLALCSQEWEQTDLLKTMMDQIPAETDLKVVVSKQQSRSFEACGFTPFGLEAYDIDDDETVSRMTAYEECGIPNRVIRVRLPGMDDTVLAGNSSSV